MAEDIELTEKEAEQYVRGFNAGYQLQKHNPKLMKDLQLDKKFPELIYNQGMIEGAVHRQKEQYLEELQKKADKSKSKNLER